MELRLQLGLNTTYDPLRRDDDISFLYESPYSEYRDLVLKGVFLEPPKLKEQKSKPASRAGSISMKRPSTKTCTAMKNRRQNPLGLL